MCVTSDKDFIVNGKRFTLETSHPNFVSIVFSDCLFGLSEETRVSAVHVMDGNCISAEFDGFKVFFPGLNHSADSMHLAAYGIEAVTGFKLKNMYINDNERQWYARYFRNPEDGPSIPWVLRYYRGGYVRVRDLAIASRSLTRKRSPWECSQCKRVSKASPIIQKKLLFCSQPCLMEFNEKLCLLKNRAESIKASLRLADEKSRQKEALRIAKQSHHQIKKLMQPLDQGALKLLREELETLQTFLK